MFYWIKKIFTLVSVVCISALLMTACTGGKNPPAAEPTPTPESTPPAASEPPSVSEGRVAEVEARGDCGDGVSWEYGDGGTLAVYGSGAMDDYEAEGEDRAPWSEFAITKVYIHEGVTSIGDFAFYNMASVGEVSISATVAKVGYDAFEGTAWLGAQSEQFVIVGDGVLIKYNGASGDVTIPHGVKYISNAFAEYTDPDAQGVDIVSVKMADSVAAIGSHAFYGCHYLHNVDFSESIEVIGESAFENSGIRSDIALPAAVRRVESRAFAMCKELYGIKISDNLEYIGDFAFADSGLSHFEIAAKVNTIGKNPFLNCLDITRIDVSAENLAFASDEMGILYNKDFTELIACPDTIGYSEIIIPETVVTVRDYAFLECATIESVYVPATVENIGESAFDGAVIIKGKANSAAHKYAQENGLAFEKAELVASAYNVVSQEEANSGAAAQ